jgi:hypothetical protein
MPMPMFSVRVPDPAAHRFDAAAADHGGRSALLRRLVIEAGGDTEAQTATPTIRSIRLMVRLGPEDGLAVQREAAAMGLRPSSWVAALVHRRVRGAPRFALHDEVALLAIRGEVHRIGINANQIARALNTAVVEGKVLDLEVAYLDDLRRELRGHLAGLAEAFAGNLAYWDVGP